MSNTAARSSIAAVFSSLRAAQRIALMPFVPAGYPDLETTAAVLPALEAAGADMIEIGIPFSDPIADGPVIQDAFTKALARKLTVSDVLATVRQARPKVSVPLLAMVSYSIVYRFGVERFCAAAHNAGFDGMIVPDLPPPEAQTVCQVIRAAGLDTVLLVAPTSSPERRAQIASLCSGFVYYLSVSGTTGARDQLPADLAANVTALRALTDRPICVGFGISRPGHVAQLSGVADGAIIGSALVRAMAGAEAAGPAAIAAAAKTYLQELAPGPRREQPRPAGGAR